MFSSQVRQFILRDMAANSPKVDTKNPTKSKDNSIIARIQSQNQATQYKALEDLENIIRFSHSSNFSSERDAIVSQCDVCIQAILRYMKRRDTTIKRECKAVLVLAYFTGEFQVFPRLSKKIVGSIVNDLLVRLETASTKPQDSMLLPILFMLIANFEFNTNIIETELWGKLASLVVNSVCRRSNLQHYIYEINNRSSTSSSGSSSSSSSTATSENSRSNNLTTLIDEHTVLQYVAALNRLLIIVPSALRETAPIWVVHLCYCSLSTHSKLNVSAKQALASTSKKLWPVPSAVEKALSAEMGEIGENNALFQHKSDKINLLTILENRANEDLLKSLSTWQYIVHLLGKRVSVKTKSKSSKRKSDTILNRLLCIATFAFSAKGERRILIRTTIMCNWRVIMDHFIMKKGLGSANKTGRKTLEQFKVDHTLSIIIKPLRGCLKSHTNVPEERLACFNTWSFFCKELHKVSRLIFPNILAQVMIPLLIIFLNDKILRRKAINLIRFLIKGLHDGDEGDFLNSSYSVASSSSASFSSSAFSFNTSLRSSHPLSNVNAMLLIVLSGEQFPDMMPNLKDMDSSEHQLLKQHMKCLPDLFQQFSSTIIPENDVNNILQLSKRVINHIEAASTEVKGIPPTHVAPASGTSSSSSGEKVNKNKRAQAPFSSSKKRKFLTKKQREMAAKNRPTYTMLDGTQHSAEEESDDNESGEDILVGEYDGSRFGGSHVSDRKLAKKKFKEEIEEEIEEFDSVAPSSPIRENSDEMLLNFAKRNSLDIKDLKEFLKRWDKNSK
jgi:hypothetical protein